MELTFNRYGYWTDFVEYPPVVMVTLCETYFICRNRIALYVQVIHYMHSLEVINCVCGRTDISRWEKWYESYFIMGLIRSAVSVWDVLHIRYEEILYVRGILGIWGVIRFVYEKDFFMCEKKIISLWQVLLYMYGMC